MREAENRSLSYHYLASVVCSDDSEHSRILEIHLMKILKIRNANTDVGKVCVRLLAHGRFLWQ
jgi:hypothetical protein